MPDFIPVDHDPFAVSLVPVDHDPFSADGMVERARAELAGQPDRVAGIAIRPVEDVGEPLIGDGGQFSEGTRWGNKAADIGSKLGYGAIVGLATLPRRAIENSQYALDTGNYDPSAPLEAATMVMGGGAGGAPAAAGERILGSGPVRKLPTDNYLGPVSRYTDTLYREMHPSEALLDLPTSVASGGYGPMGAARKFYADHPDLALGQGNNRGVRVQYDAEPFEGTINKQKPAWDLSFQNGMAEYVASPRAGANIRDSVRGFEIDPKSLSRVESAQYQRILTNLKDMGWSVEKTDGKIVASAPKAPAAQAAPTGQPNYMAGLR